MLYIVATPIGNLKDITFRAVEILHSVDLILAEDTRSSSVLLKTYNIQTKMRSFHKFNEKEREKEVIDFLLSGGEVALISDAGTPGICDPGGELICTCRAAHIPVRAIPGPCAAIAAMSLCGKSSPFQFVGFIEKRGKSQLLAILSYSGLTIAYESPHHLLKTLHWIETAAPEMFIFIARELTKIHEETLEGTARKHIDHFQQKKKILGEYVLIFSGTKGHFDQEPQELIEELQKVFGISAKEALIAAAKLLGIPKRELYHRSHRKGH